MSRIVNGSVAVVALFLLSSQAHAVVDCKIANPVAYVEANKYLDCGETEYKIFGSQQIRSVTLRLTSTGQGTSSVHFLTIDNLPNSMNRLQNYSNKDYQSNPVVTDRIKAGLPSGVNYKIEGITGFKTMGEQLLSERPRGSTGGGAVMPVIPFNPDAKPSATK